MKSIKLVLLLGLLTVQQAHAQKIKFAPGNLTANKVYMTQGKFHGRDAVRVIKDSTVKEADEPTFVRINTVDFKNGTIEVSVFSRLLPTASPTDRGFIGLAFRINDANSGFECIYIRPTNGRADNQVRRNHSIQYFSFPDYKFSRLRKKPPNNMNLMQIWASMNG